MSLYEVTAFSLNYNGPVRNLCLITSGFLRYEEREVYSTTAKFGYEDAQNGQGVHFRCLHNNKYLVRSPSSNWIAATAGAPEEDVSKEGCTLFRLEILSNTSMKWVHVQTSKYVSIFAPSDATNGYYLCIDPTDTNPNHVECTPIDVERIIKLPKTVVFKGDNKKYMQVQDGQIQLFSGEDRGRKESWYEIFPISNGDVRIKCVRNGRFLRRTGDGTIVADSTDITSSDPNTVFQVARLSDKSIALVNRGNNLFCEITTSDNPRFNARVDSGVKEAGLEVEEPIVSRNVEVEYRLKDARIYGVQPRSWLSQVAFNEAGEGDLQTTLSITYTEALSCSFHTTTSVSTNISVTTTFSASIPFVADVSTEIGFSAGKTVETGFGTTVDKSEEFQFTATVTVPPRQKRRARVMALEAKCDVPFSYVLTEVQADNTVIRTNLQDGVYKGMNGYEFHVQVYNPDEPDVLLFDEPVATHVLPDTLAREKIYLKMN